MANKPANYFRRRQFCLDHPAIFCDFVNGLRKTKKPPSCCKVLWRKTLGRVIAARFVPKSYRIRTYGTLRSFKTVFLLKVEECLV